MVNVEEAAKLFESVAEDMRCNAKGHMFMNKGVYRAMEDKFTEVFDELSDTTIVSVGDIREGIEIVWLPKPYDPEAVALKTDKTFVTALGCKVSVVDSPDHLGTGSLIEFSVDSRRAEVFLSVGDKELLRKMLEA